MEPMTLGSPVQTPPHLNYGTPSSHGHQPQTGFLPGYLMGDPTSPSSPSLSSHRPMISPTKLQLNRSLSIASSGTPQSPAPAPQRGPPLLAHNVSLNRSHLKTPGEKHGAPPPTLSLMGGLTPNRTNNSAIGTPFGTPQTPMPSTPQLSFGATPNICMAREEIPYSSEPVLYSMDMWVTVFGFPPSAASYILSQFSACGTVLQHTMPPNANWMHLKFQTRLEAKKAISKNGTVLGSTIMVGVSPCSDSSVLENLNTSVTSPLHDTSMTHSVSNINSSLGTPRSIRPLTQAYKDAQGEFKEFDDKMEAAAADFKKGVTDQHQFKEITEDNIKEFKESVASNNIYQLFEENEILIGNYRFVRDDTSSNWTISQISQVNSVEAWHWFAKTKWKWRLSMHLKFGVDFDKLLRYDYLSDWIILAVLFYATLGVGFIDLLME